MGRGCEGLIAAPQGPQDFGLHSFFITLFHFPLLGFLRAVLLVTLWTLPAIWQFLIKQTLSIHLEAARMNNLIADTAFHEFLLKVLCLFILIYLTTEGTCD